MASEHYETVGVQSLADRAKGPAYDLKKRHNAIKRDLLERYATGALLDIGCGRGGDVLKWSHVTRVLGIDISENELLEARRRAEGKPYTFECRDVRLGFALPGFDVVSAMFCLNYFWESEETASRVLDSVAASLKSHGKFIGCYAEADAVRRWVASEAAHSLLDIRPLSSFYDPGEFGQAYQFTLRDTVLDRGCAEYLVSARCLKTMCAQRGLEQIWSSSFSDVYKTFAFVKL